MKRVAAIAAGFLALVLFVTAALGSGNENDGGSYLVRAYFDNGSFTVQGQDVRVGGANVGVIDSVDVSLPGEQVSYEPGEEVKPGTALVVLKIEDPGYQDFREDASCILRPQSLIGERFVDCTTTEPRTDTAEAPPELEVIPEGEPGEGQRLLPLENNGRTVDIDLVNSIYREPYVDRFRIILNELGAGFATRGEDLAEIVERADPTLREGNKVLEKLAQQRETLARLTRDSDEILKPLAAARGDLVGFIENAAVPAEVTAARRAQLEEALAQFPTFIRELRATMLDFDQFTTAAAPVLDDLGVAAPDLNRSTKALAPFARASTAALRSLGAAGERAGPLFTEANPIINTASKLAITGQSPTRNLRKFLGSVEETGGFEQLMELIYNTGASVNGYDQYGNFLRTYLLAGNCVDYEAVDNFNCNASFRDVDFLASSAAKKKTELEMMLEAQAGDQGASRPGGEDEPSDDHSGDPGEEEETEPEADPAEPDPPAVGGFETTPGDSVQRRSGKRAAAVNDLLSFLVAP